MDFTNREIYLLILSLRMFQTKLSYEGLDEEKNEVIKIFDKIEDQVISNKILIEGSILDVRWKNYQCSIKRV